MSTASGKVHHVHPLFASFIGNYPEQVLSTCTLNGDCPTCGTTSDNLGDFHPDDKLLASNNPDDTLDVLDSFHLDPAGFLQAFPYPFWLRLPYSNIFHSITPNGVIKHLKNWILIDAQHHHLPQNHNIHLFMKGISGLSQVTAHTLLDFLYLTQYPLHSHSMLQLLTDALTCFHANRDIFISLRICTQFNIPKLHYLTHYIESIEYLGTTDNFNMQFMEWLHIDLAKDIYAATNRKDKGEQMTNCLDWKDLDTHWHLSMMKHPTISAVPLDRIQDSYEAPLFKFMCPDPLSGTHETADSIHVKLARHDKHKHLIQGHFNTALINDRTGMELGIKGYHIGHVHMVFSIPRKYHNHLFKPTVAVLPHLAYVKWYLPLTESEPNHRLFKICPQKDSEGNRICSIVPVGNIWQSVHLLPKFRPVMPAEWTSSNVLDQCDVFYLNTFSDQRMFHTTTC
ncbi:hypothetical protein EI94DRAFT_1769482 [Lactarius quietus]|nr:hypothetical protein EI94DRAFT_1769482 [Lactarius quietus]